MVLSFSFYSPTYKWSAVQVNKENPILQTEFGSKNYD